MSRKEGVEGRVRGRKRGGKLPRVNQTDVVNGREWMIDSRSIRKEDEN